MRGQLAIRVGLKTINHSRGVGKDLICFFLLMPSLSALRSERNELQERLNELQCKNCRADRENCEHDCVVTDPKEGLHVWNKGACATIVLVVDCDDVYDEQSFIALDNGKRIQFGRRPIPEMIHSLKYNCHCPCIQEDNQYYHEY